VKHQHILIAGAGIGGLATALALARTGQRVTVLERAAQFAPIGAGIQLGPNAMKVLDSWGLREAVLAQACLPEAIAVSDVRSGRSIHRILLGAAVLQRYGQPYASVHRASLHTVLLNAVQQEANVQLLCDTAVLAVQQAPDATDVHVQTSSQAMRADALAAADGVWSSVRQAVFADGQPRATGHAAYRALLPMALVPPALRGGQVEVWWGADAHVVHYPVMGGQFLNLVVLSAQPVAQAAQSWANAVTADHVLASVPRACAALKNLLSAAQTWQSWHLYDRPAARAWVQGRVALLGDAAHPMLPYLAQGAAMAIEDAQALAQCVDAGQTMPGALQAYQQQRKARAERVVATARRNGWIFHLPAPWAQARNAVLAVKGTEVLGLPWLYGY
jgi:salicylate hydroxylase